MEEENQNQLPEYIRLQADNTIIVETKEGNFRISEPDGETIDSVERLAKGLNLTDFKKTMILIVRCLIEPAKIDEATFLRYKLSTLQRLAVAMNYYVDETKSFLWTTALDLKTTVGKASSSESPFASTKPTMK